LNGDYGCNLPLTSKLLVVEQLIRLAVLVMVTEYFPGLSTTIEADVSPVDHKYVS
jgi:hypothetical protein